MMTTENNENLNIDKIRSSDDSEGTEQTEQMQSSKRKGKGLKHRKKKRSTDVSLSRSDRGSLEENTTTLISSNVLSDEFVDMHDFRASVLQFNDYEVLLKRRIILKEKEDQTTNNINKENEQNYGDNDMRKISATSAVESNLGSSRRKIFPDQAMKMSTILQNQAESSSESPYELVSDLDLSDSASMSLGMKLTILAGRVIVQDVTSLQDGRASPAQLTRKIKRGDVLIMIDGLNLRGIGSTELMQALSPLSPTLSETRIKVSFQLRFSIGEGLSLLRSEEKNSAIRKAAADEDDFFNKFMPSDFNMVDHMSGMPLFPKEDTFIEEKKTDDDKPIKPKESSKINSSALKTDGETPNSKEHSATKGTSQSDDDLDPLESIMYDIVKKMKEQNWESNFYQMDSTKSQLLRVIRKKDTDKSTIDGSVLNSYLSQKDRITLGTKAMKGASMIFQSLQSSEEKLLYGVLYYPLRKRSSNRSLLSIGNKKSGYHPDNVYLPDQNTIEEEDEGYCSYSDSDSDTVASKLLSDTWKQKILYQLEQATQSKTDTSNDDGRKQNKHPLLQSYEDSMHDVVGVENTSPRKKKLNQSEITEKSMIDVLSSTQQDESGLESLFFGNQAKALTSQTKSLPPSKLTLSLFELVMSLEQHFNTSGNVSVLSSPTYARSLVGNSTIVTNATSIITKKSRAKANKVFFLFREALPRWLQTFVPLSFKHRKLLWSITSNVNNTQQVNDDDSVSMESLSSLFSSTTKKQNWRDIIRETKLNPETKMQTCYLVTLYFVQRLIPDFRKQKKRRTSSSEMVKQICSYVEKYGAYIDIYPCLISVSKLGPGKEESEQILSSLIDIAHYDPVHEESMIALQKKNTLQFYEPTMLSAILDSLKNMTFSTADIPLLTLAYPDLKPWQVKKVFLNDDTSESKDESISSSKSDKIGNKLDLSFYYVYLSTLLHQSNGHHQARHDIHIVNEWCEWSALKKYASDERKNFYIVAKSLSSLYARDLSKLISLSMEIQDYNLALQLVDEISVASNSKYMSGLPAIVSNLRVIGKHAIENVHENTSDRKIILKQVVQNLSKIHHKWSHSGHSNFPPSYSFSIVEEILYLLNICDSMEQQSGSNTNDDTIISVQDFISFLSQVANPHDVLATLEQKWPYGSNSLGVSTHDFFSLIPIIKSLLKDAAEHSLESKYSGALLRLQRAREEDHNRYSLPSLSPRLSGGGVFEFDDKAQSTETNHSLMRTNKSKIWEKVLSGRSSIEK